MIPVTKPVDSAASDSAPKKVSGASLYGSGSASGKARPDASSADGTGKARPDASSADGTGKARPDTSSAPSREQRKAPYKDRNAESGASASDRSGSRKPSSGKPSSGKPSSGKDAAAKAPYGQKSKKPPARRDDEKTTSALYGEVKPEGLHPRNVHQGRYDMAALVVAVPELEYFLQANPRGEQTIDFSDNNAVVCLNKALLKHHYGVQQWSILAGFLCPPIPGRADYVHYLADLLTESAKPSVNATPRVLDIGTGANLIYPIIGSSVYGWQFTATDVDATAIRNAHAIISANPALQSINILMQRNSEKLFGGMIRPDDYFDLTLCNPPFFASQKEAEAQARRKWRNLKGDKASVKRNFGGQGNELWCEGGELAFIKRMIHESVEFSAQVGWFSSLVSAHDHLPALKQLLRKLGATDIKTVPMAQGQKVSRFIAWTFQA
ncbi:23S rRNA (adenine(1618)-N(6))-methyltransferase RlmF [Thalassolituus hydrocarboniclasticus]|uniref:Ribosomal RNA large subunit methyltransferase F n=1 Tax=Thalassolituus hydrocarboniclasticus TaxID=2742796 RepID=A0ABY6AJ29_9GAMM|nr:23S rRNA (adenine(1618)-N(6))-methyltransferase RlmF [Thalassolituus hydrocarboniclasticus]